MWQIGTRRVSVTHGNGVTPEDSHHAVVEQLSTRRLFYTPAGKKEPLYPPSPPRRSSSSQLLAQSREDGNPMSFLMRIFIRSFKGKKKILVRSKMIWIWWKGWKEERGWNRRRKRRRIWSFFVFVCVRENSRRSMGCLPDEIWTEVLKSGVERRVLDYRDLCIVALVCRRLRRLSSLDSLWHLACQNDFGNPEGEAAAAADAVVVVPAAVSATLAPVKRRVARNCKLLYSARYI
jgi:hypothetical protein